MSAGIIIAIGILVGAALAVALVAIRRAGGECGPDNYGRELDAPPPMQGRRGRYGRPGSRQRSALVAVAAALAALGAALAAALSHGHH
jgi:hypothetical protein